MAKLIILATLLLTTLQTLNSTTSTTTTTEFVKTECRATRYPALCFQTLSSYPTSNRDQLAQAAVSVSLSRAQSASIFVSKVARMRGMKYGAVTDCVQAMGDAVDQLTRSTKELGRVNGQDFSWHVGNVQTWVSTALTNQNMCLTGVSREFAMEGNVRDGVTKRVLDCARVTSNALALVNRFATRHRQ